MNNELYKNFLLNRIPTANTASGGKVVNCRCFYCPDGKNPKSKHFYISIPQSADEPSLYYCHKCLSSGIVTHNTLIDWGIYDEKIALMITEHNKNCRRYVKNAGYFNDSIYNLNNDNTTIDETSEIKRRYLCERLGLDLSYDYLRKMKIVLNLYDLFKSNNINTYTRDKNIVSQLSNNFIGFLSIDNAFLNMRRVCDEGLVYKTIDKRYINYKIFDKFNTEQRFYTIPTSVNILQPDPIKIHIAEGPMDILSIYENLRNREEGIYSSIGGSNYKSQVLYFLRRFKLPYTEIHLYPDNDKQGSNNKIKWICKTLSPLRSKFYIHRNMYPNEKDFGVPKDKIDEKIIPMDNLLF